MTDKKSTHATYEQNIAKEKVAQEQLANERKKKQDVKDAKAGVAELKGYIKKLEEAIIAPAKKKIKDEKIK